MAPAGALEKVFHLHHDSKLGFSLLPSFHPKQNCCCRAASITPWDVLLNFTGEEFMIPSPNGATNREPRPRTVRGSHGVAGSRTARRPRVPGRTELTVRASGSPSRSTPKVGRWNCLLGGHPNTYKVVKTKKENTSRSAVKTSRRLRVFSDQCAIPEPPSPNQKQFVPSSSTRLRA